MPRTVESFHLRRGERIGGIFVGEKIETNRHHADANEARHQYRGPYPSLPPVPRRTNVVEGIACFQLLAGRSEAHFSAVLSTPLLRILQTRRRELNWKRTNACLSACSGITALLSCKKKKDVNLGSRCTGAAFLASLMPFRARTLVTRKQQKGWLAIACVSTRGATCTEAVES